MTMLSTLFHILLLYIFYFNYIYAHMNSKQMQTPVPVHVVMDMNSPFGAMVNLCMDMAISDFYSSHSNYETRLQLIKKDVKNTLDFNLAVVDLVKHEQVLAILESQGLMQETFAAAVGEAALVPIVSFTARSSALSYTQNSYIFRTSLDDAVEAEALAAICGRFGWSEAVILYEDTQFGNQFLSHTIKAFQDSGIRLTYMVAISLSAEDSLIRHELSMINAKQTRVFLVHVNYVLGSRLFTLANDAGMMSQGYAWIVTDSISIFLNAIISETRESMDGVVGIRPYVMSSKNLKSFCERWKSNMATDPVMDLNIYGLWAYDTVSALAIAVENTKPVDSSSFGPKLVSELSKTKFGGLAGYFELVDGKLKGGTYEIFNIIGNGERRVGFWSRERGITREVRAGEDGIHSKSDNEMRKIFWPGDSVIQPTGWSIPPTGSLRVGIPCEYGFIEFVNLVIDPATNETCASGFAVDVFLEAVKLLPFPVNYTFHCINDSTAEDWGSDIFLHKIKEYDIVVADITIWAPRAEQADFSLPYSESGIVLVVKNKKPFDMWIFIRPLRWDLWLAIVVSSMLIGIVLCILENRDRPGVIYLSPIAILAFQDRHMVSNNWSVFVLVCWLFMAFILMQSFTANLSAILTLDQLKFSFSEGYYVGYQEGSFMKKFLTENLNINESSLRSYSSIQEYHDGMTRGSKNGGVDAIFDELPYMKLLMNRYESQYKIVGPTYNTDGFGFGSFLKAFPPESPLVRYFSKAILKVTQGPNMIHIERKNLGPGYSSQDPLSSVISQGTSSLTLQQFAGLFLLTGTFLLFALFCSKTSIGQQLTQITQHFLQSCLSFTTPKVHSSFVGEGGSYESSEFDHDHDHDNGGASPREGDDARVLGDETAEISETAPENESGTAQNAGEIIENEELRNS